MKASPEFSIQIAAALLALLAGVSCGYQLERPRGEPVYPVEGLWASVDDDYTASGRGQLLYVSSPGEDKYPYKFIIFQYYMRDLALSGKRMFFTRRMGVVDTSDSEVLLIQTKFQSGFRDNISESDEKEFWPAVDFEPETLKRNFGDGDELDLLTFQKDGGDLLGDDFHFRRLLPAVVAGGQTTQAAEMDVAVVLGVRKDGRETLSIAFSPTVHVQDGVRELWNNAGNAGRLKIHTLSSDFAQATVLNGKVRRGDVVLLPGWKPVGVYKRKLSREEVLRKIQRGEPVPREDLIRVLGEDAGKNVQ